MLVAAASSVTRRVLGRYDVKGLCRSDANHSPWRVLEVRVVGVVCGEHGGVACQGEHGLVDKQYGIHRTRHGVGNCWVVHVEV